MNEKKKQIITFEITLMTIIISPRNDILFHKMHRKSMFFCQKQKKYYLCKYF